MAARICLQVVQPEQGKDSIIPATQRSFPILKGRDRDHLACGACNEVIAWNVSGETAREMFMVASRLLLRCRCGAHNLVRPQRLGPEPAEAMLIAASPRRSNPS